MELLPMTTSGKAQRLKPRISMEAWKPARNRKHQPPPYNVQAGVQIRLTTGQIPQRPARKPRARPSAPATANQRTLAQGGRWSRRILPAIKPSIIVASVGIKASVV